MRAAGDLWHHEQPRLGPSGRVGPRGNGYVLVEWSIALVERTNPAFNLWVAAVPASVPIVRHRLDTLLDSHELPTDRAGDIRLAVTEAATNAILHAYPTPKHGDVLITADISRDVLTMIVRDYGAGIQPNRPSNGRGVGLRLIHHLADTVDITDAEPGLALRMTFRL
jgi:anti-sigma regulatory factor (Ser/Thr protein kinase)